MIKKIGDDKYRFQIENIVYYLDIRYSSWSHKYLIGCYNRASIYSFYRKLQVFTPGEAANQCFSIRDHYRYSNPTFNTKEECLQYLYYLDRKYNPTPQPINEMQIINLKLLLPS